MKCYGTRVTPAAAMALLALAGDASPSPAGERHGDPAAREEPLAADRAPERGRSPDVVVPTLHAVALMGVMRATETVLWPRPFAEPEHFAWHYGQAYTRPPKFDGDKPFMQWDGDPLAVNVVGHGLFGSELYLRARQCRLGWAGSLAFAAASSVVWEYVFEANGVRPSAVDLVYTPLAGVALGEVRFVLHRLAGGIRSPSGRAIVRVMVDPLGEMERAAGTDC